MQRWMMGALVAAGVATGLTGTAGAAECDPGKAADDMTYEDAQKVYECIGENLHAGYAKGAKRWIPADYVNDYRSWKLVSRMPANPGFHSNRYLVTYVNDVGADAYMDYAEDPTIPAGTLIAKESFDITDDGKVRPGPLFLMEKVEAGKSPETNDWYYMMVAANGTPQAVPVMTACNTCHMENFGHQGGLGYPVEDVRVAK